MSKGYTHIVRAAGGTCPIKFDMFWDLRSLPPDTVISAWFWEVREYGLRRGEFLTAEAIANWASGEFPMNTDEFDYIYESIMEYAKGIGELDLDDAVSH